MNEVVKVLYKNMNPQPRIRRVPNIGLEQGCVPTKPTAIFSGYR